MPRINTGRPPGWMNRVLALAAIYNLSWGALAILFPRLPFDWIGFEHPNHPSLWQCIGMLVGVYGIGYAIAALDPVRHWPIVLVGLLGKIFGPIGFAWSAARGELPWIAGLTILTNDLIWWLPFGLILAHSLKQHRAAVRESSLDVRDNQGCTERVADSSGRSARAATIPARPDRPRVSESI